MRCWRRCRDELASDAMLDDNEGSMECAICRRPTQISLIMAPPALRFEQRHHLPMFCGASTSVAHEPTADGCDEGAPRHTRVTKLPKCTQDQAPARWTQGYDGAHVAERRSRFPRPGGPSRRGPGVVKPLTPQRRSFSQSLWVLRWQCPAGQ